MNLAEITYIPINTQPLCACLMTGLKCFSCVIVCLLLFRHTKLANLEVVLPDGHGKAILPKCY